MNMANRERSTAERIRALARCNLPASEIRKRVGMKPIEFEQLAARNGIALCWRKGEL